MTDRKDMEPCLWCDGTGMDVVGDCPRCNGTGWEPERITERVPPPRPPDPAELVKAELERYREQGIEQRIAGDGVEWAIECIGTFEMEGKRDEPPLEEELAELKDWVELLIDKAQKLVDTVDNQKEG